MAKSGIKDIKAQDIKALIDEKNKKQVDLVVEKANLAQSGKKNSNQTAKLKKEIARLETIITEKIFTSIG